MRPACKRNPHRRIGRSDRCAHAESLNKKFGTEWNCSRIGHGRTELDALHKACLACKRQSQDFFQTGPGTGYCVPRTGGAQPTPASPSKRRASSTSPAKPASAPKQLWCAIAAGIEESFTHQQAAVGVGNNLATKQMAEEEALSNCAKDGFAGCSVKLSWNSGCGYVTTGSSGSQVGWAMGATVDELYEECADIGLACKEPIGCCAEDEDIRLLEDLGIL